MNETDANNSYDSARQWLTTKAIPFIRSLCNLDMAKRTMLASAGVLGRAGAGYLVSLAAHAHCIPASLLAWPHTKGVVTATLIGMIYALEDVMQVKYGVDIPGLLKRVPGILVNLSAFLNSQQGEPIGGAPVTPETNPTSADKTEQTK